MEVNVVNRDAMYGSFGFGDNSKDRLSPLFDGFFQS